jgi:hypothetical protein
MSMDDKSLLNQLQDMYLQNLINLIPPDKRARAIELTDQYRQTTKVATAMAPGLGANRERYSACQYAIDAIKLYLSDTDKPLTEQEIIEGVIGAGFRPLTPGRTRGNLKKSLKQYLVGTAAKGHEIKQKNGLIGLWEWDEARFSG